MDFGCAVLAGVRWIRMGFCRLIRRSMCDVYVINIYMFNSFVCISHSLYMYFGECLGHFAIRYWLDIVLDSMCVKPDLPISSMGQEVIVI